MRIAEVHEVMLGDATIVSTCVGPALPPLDVTVAVRLPKEACAVSVTVN